MKRISGPGVMLDCSRGAVYSLPALKTFIDMLKKMGYKQLQLYTEDVYTLDGEPYFGYLRGRYTKEELRELDEYAAEHGIELVPCIQTLAHLGGILRWQAYADIHDNADILLAGEERTYELIDKMFAACAETFHSRRINIGMDEAHTVGLGKYLDKNGYGNRFDILFKHLQKVAAIAEKYDFRPMMWSDMFFRLAYKGNYYVTEPDETASREISALIPANIDLIYWDYYSRDETHYDAMIKAHKLLKQNGIVFAGGAWCWSGFAPSNAFSIEASRAALAACRNNGIREIFITVWKDDGSDSSLFSVLPALFASAQYAAGNFDEEKIRARFRRIAGTDWEDFMALDLPNLPEQDGAPRNACKYMLFNDPFFGIFDRTADPARKAEFTAAKERLSACAGNKRWGYLFRTLADLCAVLEIKYDLGVRTRALYKSHNMQGLCMLVADYAECERRIGTFYESFREQWRREAKGFGFERHDVRIGGLLQRMRHCRQMLERYLTGELPALDELEQDILPFYENAPDGRSLLYNDWLRTATVLGS